MVRSDDRSREAVLDALRRGAFYGTSGPEIASIQVGEDGVDVRCSGARAVTLRSGPWDGGRVNADPDVMTWRGRVTERDSDGAIVAATMRFPEQCSYARVEVEDCSGHTAWSNPFAVPTDPGGEDSSY